MEKELITQIETYVTTNKGNIPEDAKKEFCKLWPDIKKGLEVLETILKAIPGAAVAIPFIAALVGIGDTISKAICGS